MPKVPNLKRVLEALTTNNQSSNSTLSGNANSSNKEPDFGEHLKDTQFQPCKTVRHGFPYHPTAMAYDCIQKVLAIGCYSGSIRLFGQPGVDCHVVHEGNSAVIQLVFLANQGALISVCADNTIHLWNLRQKKPAILHSLKFKRENINCCHLPHQCNWLYIGTERGNTHLCNVEKFALSGYSISWNKAIELSQKTHPGRVVAICENPTDENKVLICFATGFAVLWDLKNKTSDQRYHCSSGIRCACWHFEGKHFMCCHDNGSLTTWSNRSNAKPLEVQFPHAKKNGDSCHPIEKVQWHSCKNNVSIIVFSGGLSRSLPTRSTVTVMRGRSITVLEVDHPIIDFTTLVNTPWACDHQEPTALTVLSDQELLVVDLEAPGYPSVELGHAMDIHDSPVTCLKHVPDPNTDLIPGLYTVASSKPHNEGNKKKEWPITGGEWGASDSIGIPEIFVTGHADGSVRFWDASTVCLKALYKLRTKKLFTKEADVDTEDEDPLQITHIDLCPESRTLVVANSSAMLIVFKFNTQEAHLEISTLNIPSTLESPLNENNPDHPNPPSTPLLSETKELPLHPVETDTMKINDHHQPISKQESEHSSPGSNQEKSLLKVKSGQLRQSPGFHVHLLCPLLGNDLDASTPLTYLTMNTSYQLLAFGTTTSLCVVDMVQKSCLLNMSTDSLLTSIDKRVHPKSPIKLKPGLSELSQSSFSFDHTSTKLSADNIQQEAQTKPIANNISKLGAGVKKSWHPRKTLGDLFIHSPQLFRRSHSLVPKTPVVPAPPLMPSRHSFGLYNGGTLSPIMSSPEEEWPSPIGKAADEINSNPTQTFSANRNGYCDHVKRQSDDKAPSAESHVDAQGSSSNQRSALSSTSSVSSSAPRLRKHASRVYRKTASCSFERSLDSTTSADESAFSRASSVSDTDRSSTRESVSFLTFACTYTKKTDSSSSSCLWVGTNGGYLFNVVINLPSTCVERSTQFVAIAPSGSLMQMKGGIVYCAFLSSNGNPLSAGAGNWREHCSASHSGDPSKPESPDTPSKDRNHSAVDKQFMVVCSDKQAKVFTLPSQTCFHSISFNPDVGHVEQANVDTIENGMFVACFSSNGYITVYGLPSLNLLLESAYLPANDERISNTFCFAPNGQGAYLSTPSEIQRIAYSVDTNEIIQEVVGSLFIPCVSPERPNPGFFKGLFGGGHSSLDREELFGAGSGRASRSVAEHIPGTGGASLEGLRGSSSGLASDMQRLRMQTQERGEKLGELEDRTQRMQDSAAKFSSDAHAMMLKFKNKKWYQM